MPPLTDTSLEAEEVLRQVYREMPFERKWHQMGVIYHTAKVLHAAGVRLQNPAATDEEIHEAWMTATLGEPRSKRSRRQLVEGNDDNLGVVQEVIQALTDLEVPYALGGSWASSLLGKMRFTHDADLTVEPFP